MYSLRVASAQRALASGKLDEIRFAFHELDSEPHSSELVAVLCTAMGGANWSVRKLAAARLIKLGETTIPALEELLSVGNADQVYWACQVLARIEPSPAPRLQMMLQRTDVNHRRFALHALERRPSADAIDGLVAALDDPSWEIRKRAAQALLPRLDDDGLLQLVRSDHMRATRNRVYWSVQLLCRRMGASVIPLVMKFMPWDDDDLRQLVISTMAQLRVEGVADLLASHAGDRSLLIRRESLQNLVALGPEAMPAVEKAYDAGNDAARLGLLRVMAAIDPNAFVRRARDLRASRRPEDRYLLLESVGVTQLPEGITLALSLFKDPLQALRGFACDTLAGLGAAAVPALKSVADGHDHDLKYWAIHTLGRMGQTGLDGLRDLLEHRDFETRALILQAFSNIELPDTFLPVLLGLFGDAHWPFRRQAADCLVARGIEAARILIKPALEAEGDQRFWARKVLGDLRLPHMPDWLHALEGMPSEQRTRVLAAIAVARPDRLAAWLGAAPEQARTDLEEACKALTPPAPATYAGPERRARPPVQPDDMVYPAVAGPPPDFFDRPIQLGDELVIPAPVRARFRFPPRTPPEFVTAKAEAPLAPPKAQPVAALPSEPLAELARLLGAMNAPGAVELHLKAGARPVARVVDRMVTLEFDPLEPGLLHGIAEALGASGQVAQLCAEVPTIGRCRVRVLREARGTALIVRPLPAAAPTLDEIGAEPQLQALRKESTGLILISGGAESGRTSTMAALIGAINEARPVRITCIESPSEHMAYPHPGLVTLVSIPAHFSTHAEALHHALGRGAEVVALDDVPDTGTAHLALEAAGTHLVIALMRARGAVEALEQFAQLTGADRGRHLGRLASVLRASVCQSLLPHATDRRWVCARELVMGTDSVTGPLAGGRFGDLRDRLQLRGSSVVRSMAESVSDLRRKGLVARKS